MWKLLLLLIPFLFFPSYSLAADELCVNYCEDDTYYHNGLYSTFLGNICVYEENYCENGCLTGQGCINPSPTPTIQPTPYYSSTNPSPASLIPPIENLIPLPTINPTPSPSSRTSSSVFFENTINFKDSGMPKVSLEKGMQASFSDGMVLLETSDKSYTFENRIIDISKGAQSVSITTRKGNPVYRTTKQSPTYLLGILKTNKKVKTYFDTDSMNQVEVEPWWNIIASDTNLFERFSNQKGGCVEWKIVINSNSNIENPNGTSDKPFNNLTDALSFGEENGCKSIILEILPGNYQEETLEINQDTKIVATRGGVTINTGIINYGPHKLELEKITIAGENNIGLVISNPDSQTKLIDVSILGSIGQGLRQTGGHLYMNNVTIDSTVPAPPFNFLIDGEIIPVQLDMDSGAGMFLGLGAEAEINDITITNNSNGGIRISDRGTKVYVNNSTVEGNSSNDELIILNPSYVAGRGALEARNRALIIVENSQISNNEYVGLFLLNGARANVDTTDIHDTSGVSSGNNDRSYGGTNIAVVRKTPPGDSDTELEINNFSTYNAALLGMQVIDSMLKADEGEITRNSIGMSMTSPAGIHSVNTIECLGNVTLFDNTVDFDSGSELPVPDSSDLINQVGLGNDQPTPTPEEEVFCADVPSSCTWCN